MNAGANPHGLPTDVMELLHREHKRQVLELYALHGQRNGVDQPEETDRMPLEGLCIGINRGLQRLLRDVRRWARRFFDQLCIALVLLTLLGLSLNPGGMP